VTKTPSECPDPNCYNDGNYCNGNGICVDCKCQCSKTCTAIDCNPASCSPPSCLDLKVSNCSSCRIVAQASALFCVWCPNSTQQNTYTQGQCVEDYLCPSDPIKECTPPAVFVIPECPDNCTGHGFCVNRSQCDALEGKKQADGKFYSCHSSQNRTNVSQVCACVKGWKGLNCAVFGGVNIVAAAISAGIIAAIIIAILIGLMLAGGGAVAATTAFAATNITSVANNPLYRPAASAGENPLYGQ